MELRRFIYFLLAFILCVPIGTMSHEFGHYAMSKFLGYESTIHYDRMTSNSHIENDRLLCIYSDNKEAIKNNQYFIGKKEYDKARSTLRIDNLLMLFGGVFQTILVGSLGLLLLYRKRNKNRSTFDAADWVYLFMSLFWLRQVYNVIHSLFIGWYYSIEKYCGGDELRIATLLDLPNCSIAYALGLAGILICSYAILFLLPKKYRISFIVGGVMGSSIGYYLWMEILGPILLP